MSHSMRGLRRLHHHKHLSSFSSFVFNPENFANPKLPKNLQVVDVPLTLATNDSLRGYGKIVHHPDEFTVENKNFEITSWPVSGWRQLDPGTGDEAGTTEGNFDVEWKGDYFYGHNLAIELVSCFDGSISQFSY